jgi:hypothetical protein
MKVRIQLDDDDDDDVDDDDDDGLLVSGVHALTVVHGGGFDYVGEDGCCAAALSIAASHPIQTFAKCVALCGTHMQTPPRVKTDKVTRVRSLKIASDVDKIRVRRLENGSRIQKNCTQGS